MAAAEAATTKVSALRIPLGNVRDATNNFDDDNIIGGGTFGAIYKGQLLWSGNSIKIAARRLDRDGGFGDAEFWTEVTRLSVLNHPNLVSLIGYCDEGGEKVIVTKHEAKGSLAQYINNPNLTWTRRLRICVGVARALSYLRYHEGRDYAIIHLNVNSYTILLDDNWEAKLSGFEISIKQSVNRMDETIFSEPIGEMGYIDPAIENTKGVTDKSDVYSFGVVLYEICSGRLASSHEDGADAFVAEFGECINLRDLIRPDLWDDIYEKSYDRYVRLGYDCVRKERPDRPHIDEVVKKLEILLKIWLHHEYLEQNSEFWRIPFADIELATENFSEKYCVGSVRTSTWYRVELRHFDKKNHFAIEETIKTKNPRRSKRKGKKKKKNQEPQRHKNVIVVNHDDFYFPHRGEEVFFTESKTLISVKHQNIVKLLGFCVEDNRIIFVLENLSNGFLGHCFEDINKKHILTWKKRLKISIDIAHALNYIHSKVVDQNEAIQCNMGSMTIALDDNWGAKIVHFGPWEDLETPQQRRENNVYLFGILLFGILSGRPVDDPYGGDAYRESLAGRARRSFHMGTLDELIDPAIKAETGLYNFVQSRGPHKASLSIFIKIAYQCVMEIGDERPTIEIVIKELEKALSYEDERGHQQDKDLDLDEFQEALEHKLTCRVYEEQLKREQEEQEELKNQYMNQLVFELEKSSKHELMHGNLGKNSKLLRISFADIKSATNNFWIQAPNMSGSSFRTYEVESHHFKKENLYTIEEGGNKDELPDTNYVRVQCYKGQLFYTLVKMLASVKHDNIATLLGYCDEDHHRYLIFDDCRNYCFYSRLDESDGMRFFPWEERLKICIDIAHALNYLHTKMEDQDVIVNYFDIYSSNIAFDQNLGAKIVELNPYAFFPALDISNHPSYRIDPEYRKTNKLKRESNVYEFGKVLFEILCGQHEHSAIFNTGNDKGMVSTVRRCFSAGTLEEIIDPCIRDETGGNTFVLSRGPSKDSLDTFIKVAYMCVTETHDPYPTMKIVIEELEKALYLQRNNKDNPVMSLEDIKVATRYFHHENYIGGGGFGKVYLGKLHDGEGFKTIVVKRLYGDGKQQFLNELHILLKYRHESIIDIVGYCDEEDEKIIVYEYASRSSLDKYLNDASLTWLKRLNICIEVARALDFLHGGAGKQAKVVHRDIKTANILLNHDWRAKLADFGLSLISSISKDEDYVINRACGTLGYVDPLYAKSKILTTQSDVYSFGVVLFELLCGRSTYAIFKEEGHELADFIKNKFEERKHEEVVFEKIREQIVPKSLIIFQEIAYRCLCHEREGRPEIEEVLMQLNRALEFQISRGD